MPKRLIIAIPTFENILPDTFKSIYDLKIPADENGDPIYIPEFNFIRGYDCARARNFIAAKAIEEGFDYLLMVDSDIVLPSNLLLIYEEDRAKLDKEGVFLGGYLRKDPNAAWIELYKDGANYLRENQYSLGELMALNEQGTTHFRIKGGGFGCAIVPIDILKKMEYPWFHYQVYNNGMVLSEDLFFCSRAAQHDIPIWSDTRILCGHCFRSIRYE